MAYATPALRSTGDLISSTVWNVQRSNWAAYEAHAHTGSSNGAVLGVHIGFA